MGKNPFGVRVLELATAIAIYIVFDTPHALQLAWRRHLRHIASDKEVLQEVCAMGSLAKSCRNIVEQPNFPPAAPANRRFRISQLLTDRNLVCRYPQNFRQWPDVLVRQFP